jgi:hypothetical protein
VVPVPVVVVVVVSAPVAVSADAPDDIAKAADPEAAAKLITKARFIPKLSVFAKTQHIGFACVAAGAEMNKLRKNRDSADIRRASASIPTFPVAFEQR